MKTVLLLLLVLLTNGVSAETFVPSTSDSLKKGDWLTIESVHYYPYVAPGIREELPWRAENIRRVNFRATVIDLNADALTIDYTFENLYDCRNESGKPGFYYFDSRYRQDFAFEDSVSGKQVLRVKYDRKSRKAIAVDKANSTYSYSRTFIPFGVRQEGLSSYPATSARDSLNLDHLLTPVINDLLTGWKNDGTILPAPGMRVVDASFALPPNTEFTCRYFDTNTSRDSTIHKRIFISFPTEYEVGKGTFLLLTPGDSFTQDNELYTKTHVVRFQGRGSEQNNLRYGFPGFSNPFDFELSLPEQMKKAFEYRESLFQAALKKEDGKMDPYWLRVFEQSEQYLKGAFILWYYMEATDKEPWHKSGLLEWQAPCFASVNPLIDYTYSLRSPYASHYSFFLHMYANYKKQELWSDNMSLNKQEKSTPQEDYLLNKQIFSGFPRYQVNGVNLMSLMSNKMLSEIEDDYNDFITSCPDTILTNQLKSTYKKLAPFEPGHNIRETGLMITDSLRLVKGSTRKYIVLYLSTGSGLSPKNLQGALDLKKLLEVEGLASTVQLELYARFASHNSERVKPYKAIPEKQLRDLNDHLGMEYLAILMREDGTILYRQSSLADQKTILDIIRKDKDRKGKYSGLIYFFYGCNTTFLLALIIYYLYRRRIRMRQRQE